MHSKLERKARMRSLEKTRETRVKNLRLLAEHYGSMAELARKCGITPQHLNSIAGPNPIRQIAEESARRLEQTLKIPLGWLDIPRG